MNVSSVSSNQYQVMGPPPGRGRGGPPPMPAMEGVATLFGMSTDELSTQLSNGSTLFDIAEDKGVSRDDLISTMVADMKAHKPEDAPELSEAQLTEMATSIASGEAHGPGGGPCQLRGLGETGVNLAKGLSNLSDQLGLDLDELLEQLANGTSLADLLERADAYGASAQGNQLDTYL